MTATRLDGARTFPGLINERLDRVGAAAAFCGAAKRSVDPAHARLGGALAMTLLTSASLKTLQEQTIIASSHRVIGSTEVRTGFLGQRDPAAAPMLR